MGHRALVIYDIGDTYRIAHSHWGAQNLRLKHKITFDTPRAGSYPEAGLINEMATAITDGDGLDEDLDLVQTGGNQTDTDVDPPFAEMDKPCSISDVLAQHYNPMYEAVYIADVNTRTRDINVRAFRTALLSAIIDGESVRFDDQSTTPLAPPVVLYEPPFTGQTPDEDGIRDGLEDTHLAVDEVIEDAGFSTEAAGQFMKERVCNTVLHYGATIPEFSPVGADHTYNPDNLPPSVTPGVFARVKARVADTVSKVTG